MPNFDTQALRNTSKRSMYLWTQQEVDQALAYLYSRGWRPSKTTEAKGPITRNPSGSAWAMRRAGENLITDARFCEPGTPGTCGAQKALRRALRLVRGNTKLKDMVAEAKEALAKHDVIKVMDLLNTITIAIGG